MSGIPGYVVPKPGPREITHAFPKAPLIKGSMYYKRANGDKGFDGLGPETWVGAPLGNKYLMGKSKRPEPKGNGMPGPGAYEVSKADFMTHPRVLAPKSGKAKGISFVDNAIYRAGKNQLGPESAKATLNFKQTEDRVPGPSFIKPKEKVVPKIAREKFPKPNPKIPKGQQKIEYRAAEEKPPNYSFPKAKDTHFITRIVKKVAAEEKDRPIPKDSALMTLPDNLARGTKIAQTYFGYKGRQTAHNSF